MLKKIKNLDLADKNLLLLCVTAFCVSSAVQYFWLVLPFIAKLLGATDTEVGFSFAAYMGVYGLTCIIVLLIRVVQR